MKKLIYTAFFLIICASKVFAQKTDSTKIKLVANYYKLNKVQKEVAQFYLMSLKFSLTGLYRNYRARPQLVGIDKDGELHSFERYKTLYDDAKEYQEDFSINLFYMENVRTNEKGEIILAYTLLEPHWDDAPEVKSYIDRIDFGIENNDFEDLRQIHRPQKVKKLGKTFIFFYCNNYD